MSLESITTELAAIRSELKSLTKLVRKVKATAAATDGEQAKTRPAHNGFNRKHKVSDYRRAVLWFQKTELISRIEVTNAINQYITDKGLKHPDNGRVLVMDDKLKNLLEPGDTQVTYLNLQKFLSPHYIKEDKA